MCECPEGTFEANTETCPSCYPTCATCTGSSSSSCLTCSDIKILQPSGQCTCDSIYFMNATTFQCEPCDSFCKTCKGSTNSDCSSCYNNMILSNGSCTCPLAYFHSFQNGEINTCQSLLIELECYFTCNTCLERTISDCLTCVGNRVATPNVFVNGVLTYTCPCPPGTFEKNTYSCLSFTDEGCHYSCSDCVGTGSNECTSCPQNSFRTFNPLNGTCTCQEGYFDQDAQPICQSCYKTCKTCTGGYFDDCITCHENRGDALNNQSAIGGICDCPAGFYDNLVDLKCLPEPTTLTFARGLLFYIIAGILGAYFPAKLMETQKYWYLLVENLQFLVALFFVEINYPLNFGTYLYQMSYLYFTFIPNPFPYIYTPPTDNVSLQNLQPPQKFVVYGDTSVFILNAGNLLLFNYLLIFSYFFISWVESILIMPENHVFFKFKHSLKWGFILRGFNITLFPILLYMILNYNHIVLSTPLLIGNFVMFCSFSFYIIMVVASIYYVSNVLAFSGKLSEKILSVEYGVILNDLNMKSWLSRNYWLIMYSKKIFIAMAFINFSSDPASELGLLFAIYVISIVYHMKLQPFVIKKLNFISAMFDFLNSFMVLAILIFYSERNSTSKNMFVTLGTFLIGSLIAVVSFFILLLVLNFSTEIKEGIHKIRKNWNEKTSYRFQIRELQSIKNFKAKYKRFKRKIKDAWIKIRIIFKRPVVRTDFVLVTSDYDFNTKKDQVDIRRDQKEAIELEKKRANEEYLAQIQKENETKWKEVVREAEIEESRPPPPPPPKRDPDSLIQRKEVELLKSSLGKKDVLIDYMAEKPIKKFNPEDLFKASNNPKTENPNDSTLKDTNNSAEEFLFVEEEEAKIEKLSQNKNVEKKLSRQISENEEKKDETSNPSITKEEKNATKIERKSSKNIKKSDSLDKKPEKEQENASETKKKEANEDQKTNKTRKKKSSK